VPSEALSYPSMQENLAVPEKRWYLLCVTGYRRAQNGSEVLASA